MDRKNGDFGYVRDPGYDDQNRLISSSYRAHGSDPESCGLGEQIIDESYTELTGWWLKKSRMVEYVSTKTLNASITKGNLLTNWWIF